MIDVEELRIAKTRKYLINVIREIKEKVEQINANMLSDKINNYSLDKIPTTPEVEKWVDGTEIHKDLYSFRSRRTYSQDTINNLKNIGFFELFEKVIKDNNEKGIKPEIEGIEGIECLNCGTLIMSDTKTAEFNIQIQITYRIGG